MRSFHAGTSALKIIVLACLATDGAEAWSLIKGSSSPSSTRSCNKASIPPCSTREPELGPFVDTATRRQFIWQSATVFLSMQAAVANAHEEQVSSPQAPTTGSTNILADAAETLTEDTERLITEEKEVIDEIAEEETEERKATEDTNKLIAELEEKIKEEKESDDSDSSQPADEEIMQSTKNLIDNLEKEEEKIESETKELISKIESLEKAEEDLQQKEDASEAKEFLNKLKERVEEKEDLIARLKRESQKDVDPRTGRFKAMNRNDFKARAPSDFDFLQYLKESVTNNQEFERDLDAFKGLLDTKFGPLMEQMKNAESRLGPVVDEVRRTATPLVESAVDEVRKAVQEAR